MRVQDFTKFTCFNYAKSGLKHPFELGDVVVDGHGEISIIIQGFGQEEDEYRGDMNGVGYYSECRLATLDEIRLKRPNILGDLIYPNLDLLMRSLVEYNRADETVRREMKQKVQKNLEAHKNEFGEIGMTFSSVETGRLFLSLFEYNHQGSDVLKVLGDLEILVEYQITLSQTAIIVGDDKGFWLDAGNKMMVNPSTVKIKIK